MFARSAAAYVAALSSLLLGCGGSPTSPSQTGPPLSELVATAHFDFHYAANDSVDAAWQEAFHEWATRELGVSVDRRIVYNKYLTPSHMLALHNGPGNVNAWADPDRFLVHTIWPRDNHEVVHLYATALGRAVPLFNEGLAVAFQVDPVMGDMTPRWNSRHVHDVCVALRAQGRLVRLTDLLTIDGWRRVDGQVNYPAAGSFVRYLIDMHGMAPLRALLAQSTVQDPPETTQRNVESCYRRSLSELEAEWLAALAARGGG